MRTESMELTGAHNPRVDASGGDPQDDDDYINAAAGTVLYLRAAPSGPQKKDDRTPSIMRSLSPVVTCWVILLMITGLRIHYTSVISVKLKDFEDIKHQLQVPKCPENLSKEKNLLNQKEETSKKREPRFDWTTTPIPEARRYYKTRSHPHYDRPHYYYTTPRPSYNRPRYQYTTHYPSYKRPWNYITPPPYYNRPWYYNTTPRPYYNRPRYQYTTKHPSYNRPWNYDPTPFPYDNTPLYYYSTPPPYYNRPWYYNTTPRPYYNRPRYQYTTKHPSYNRPWNYDPTPFPYDNTPLYYYTTPPPYYYKLYHSQSTPSYFYRRKKRETEPCPQDWLHFQSSCYMISSWNYSGQKTWDEARDDCRLRGADLVVVGSPEEQDFIYKSSLTGAGTSGYWIGLRDKGSGWKWVNESDLKHSYWLQLPAEKDNCATAVKVANGWKSVSCDDKNGWICQQMALSS